MFVDVCFLYMLLAISFFFFFFFDFRCIFVSLSVLFFCVFHLLVSHSTSESNRSPLFYKFCILNRINGSVLTCCQHSTLKWKWQWFASHIITVKCSKFSIFYFTKTKNFLSTILNYWQCRFLTNSFRHFFSAAKNKIDEYLYSQIECWFLPLCKRINYTIYLRIIIWVLINAAK